MERPVGCVIRIFVMISYLCNDLDASNYCYTLTTTEIIEIKMVTEKIAALNTKQMMNA